MNEPIQMSVQIERITSNKDRTLSIKLETQEIPHEETAKLFALQGLQLWAAFAETPLTKGDLNIPEAMMEFKNDKTPSERLRAVLFVYWKQKLEQNIDWDIYYKNKMEQIISYIKDKLE